MLNTHKLLYILPDVAYVTELLPAKKANTFSIQSFRQINGEFMDDEVFITKNILKLFKKLNGDEYHLILPDFLFTNTIINVQETSDAKIKAYISETLLPQLNLSNDSHELETFVLTEFKGTAKVQLSAIEKSLLAPLRVAAADNDVTIEGISPLSWTIKSVVSLEPSITVLQIGSQLYTAQQYIGVDQATITPVAETDAIIETIKTLKGAEPSIQTVYLLTNEKVEKELAELLSDTIPLQQLASFKEDDSKMPSYVQQIIESGMRTLSIEEYPVPQFSLGKATKAEQDEYLSEVVEDLEEAEDDVEETDAPETKKKQADAPSEDELPTPTKPANLSEQSTEKAKTASTETEDDSQETSAAAAALTAVAATTAAAAIEPAAATVALEAAEPSTPPGTPPEPSEEPPTASVKSAILDTETSEAEKTKTGISKTAEATEDDDVDLSQFAGHAATGEATTEEILQKKTAPADTEPTVSPKKKKQVIKNSSGIGAMLRMIFITLAVFSLTVAIGVGVGLGLLQWTSQDQVADTATPTPAATATPEPTPTPTPEPEIDIAELQVLVVNATTKAGYAGTVKADLDKAGYGKVTAANAKGEYEPGNYALMSEEQPGLIAKLSEDTGLTLEFSADVETEDAQEQFDVVIVLAD